MPAPQPSLKARALRYLSQREYSRLELARKLARYVGEDDNLEALLDTLEANQWLSQERFTESLVHRRAARAGNALILAELSAHGVQGAALQEVKAELAESEVARACALWQRRFGAVASDPAARQKQVRYLMARGFSSSAIRRAVQGPIDED
ncbi:recombination regulator RecX [Massilia sp. TS11]|uniref:recombination regulator RecX n=1 Tax=Massilia sp. TS11 TaxID=2908003 RepID=UPI001EDAA255|nr:recombination regulator RecX [Massilia sp. TS11]MCG2586451.1 recombination regulator RecX [Massilia sp. TS11]